jgi:hypothetical protein
MWKLNSQCNSRGGIFGQVVQSWGPHPCEWDECPYKRRFKELLVLFALLSCEDIAFVPSALMCQEGAIFSRVAGPHQTLAPLAPDLGIPSL